MTSSARRTANLSTLPNATGDLLSATGDNAFGILSVGANGTVLVANSAATTGTSWTNVIAPASSGTTGFIIRGAASQTADLQQWQNSSGTILSEIDSAGNLFVGRPSDGLWKIEARGPALGNTAGNMSNAFSISSLTTNAQSLDFFNLRSANGSDWTTAGYRLQEKVDVTYHGWMQFGGSANARGVSFGAGNGTSTPTGIPERLRIDFHGSTKFFSSLVESATISAIAATGTVAYDITTNRNVLYYTSNATGNWTLNIRGNASTTVNTLLEPGQAITIVFMVTNGATPFFHSALQIDGVAQTVRWQGGTAPSSGNANSIDVYSFTIIETAATPTYVVLGSVTRFA